MTTLALTYLAMLGLATVAIGSFAEGSRGMRRLLLAAGCVGVALALAGLLGVKG